MRNTALCVLLWALGLAAEGAAATTQAPPDSVIGGQVPADSLPGVIVPCAEQSTGGRVVVRARRIFLSGAVDSAWTPDSSICLGMASALRASRAADASGGVFLPSLRGGGDEPDIVLDHLAGEGTFSPGWPSRGLTIAQAPHSQYHLDMAADGNGGAYLVWEDYRAGGSGDVYALRITADGSVAAGWPENGLEVCGAAGQQSLPRVVVIQGSPWITWQDRRTGDLRLFVQRLSGSGQLEPGWPAGGVLVAPSEPPSLAPTLVADSSGSVAVLWQQSGDVTGWSLVALPITNMSPEAGSQGTPIVLSANAQSFSELIVAKPGAAGILVGWTEQRGSAAMLRVQKIALTGSGQALWSDAPIRTGPVGPGRPALDVDPSGSVLVSWEESRHGDARGIFAQRLTGAGVRAAGWPEEGLAVGFASGDQFAPHIRLGGQNDAVVSWAEAPVLAPEPFVEAHPLLAGPRPQLIRQSVRPSHVRLVWQLPSSVTGSLSAQRRLVESSWEPLAAVRPDDSLHVTLDDKTAPEGTRVEYRLGFRNGDSEVFLDPVVIDVPGAPTILLLHAAWVRPSERAIRVTFALPRGPAPMIDLIDVAGRRVARERYEGLEPGEQELRFQLRSSLASGVYFLRLVQGSQSRVAKIVYVR